MTNDLGQVQAAFRFVDNIVDTCDMHWLSRIAHLHLTRMLAYLTSTVKADRENGLLRPVVGRGDASIALDVYRHSQSSESGDGALRQIKRRLRIARRWVDLTGGSLLLVLAFSDKADTVIRNFAITNRTLRSAAGSAFSSFAPELTRASCDMMQLSDQVLRGLVTEAQVDSTFQKLESVLIKAGVLQAAESDDDIL
ncbi:hypothetical protein GQ607_002375 [Colletotrichum asianum]|uniref:Uncharacterized protein n=1 Tax=Colletotrichum asianum TaxID=702518 RepID=A0A8H3WKU5_9PEZI|nr:hypothetical protein GQ607_002375 [Colletotrichum asianum]